MEKVKLSKGQVLHKKGDAVQTLEIVLSGGLLLTDGNGVEVKLESGALAGAVYLPGDVYSFDYVAQDESIIGVMDYKSQDSIVDAVTDTPAIAPVMAAASMDFAQALVDSLQENEEAAVSLCKELKYNYINYSFLCVKLAREPKKFDFIDAIITPEPSPVSGCWEAAACKAYCGQKDELKKGFYAADVSFSVSAVMLATETGRKILKALEAVSSFISWTKDGAADFVREYYDVKSRTDSHDRGGDGTPEIKDALEVILAFSGVANDVADSFRKDIKTYTGITDRRAKSDEMRTLRMRLAKGFYEIYESAFLNSMAATHIPVELRMFFLFGFVDEKLAGENYTAELYNMAVRWEIDPEGRILSMYDWLTRIFKGTAIPSKNDFNNDWAAYLRESVRTGTISQKQADELLNDKIQMVHFEIQNLFTNGNRITTGRLSSFVPMFCGQDVIRPLDKSLADPAAVQAALDKVLEIDYSLFYRPTSVEYPELQIQRFVYNLEVKPFIILMPNFGERGVMWQEIEGASRTTPAHMILSVFHANELVETLTHMCAEFRWEMCRRIQGVRYADISDLSLTSEYMDYLQFYKKNGSLTSDKKEQVKMALQKARNDYKGVFMADYEKYIANEANGQLRLNKVARDIIFRYCPFSKKFRGIMGSNQQYSQLVDRYNQNQAGKQRSLVMVEQKAKRMKPNDEIPKEILIEKNFLTL